jgi:hypothetical protein
MEQKTPPQQRRRPPLRRLLAAALSGSLGVFAFAHDAPLGAKAVAPTPPKSISSIDERNG